MKYFRQGNIWRNKALRYVFARDLQPGMVVAQELLDPSGRVLAEENSSLSEFAINRLIKDGYEGVYIQDGFIETNIYIESPISMALWARAMDCVRARDISACRDAADEIVESLTEKRDAASEVSDFRTDDNYIYVHSVNVAVLSCQVAMGLGMKNDELRDLVFAALIHDLGKMDIPSHIRNKAGRLTREEFEVMKSHSEFSYELIKERTDISEQVKEAVRSHHENIDGSGYPDGTLGETQSMFTKIIHVVDVYDALVSKTPYKTPYSPQEVIEYLMGGCGLLFDQEIVMRLINSVPMFPRGTEVELSDGRDGVIVKNTGIHNLRPIVRLHDGFVVDLAEPEYFNITMRLTNYDAISKKNEQERKEMIGDERRQCILVVDDMKVNLQMMQDMLGETYDLVLAKSGQQAISYIEKKKFADLIILDIDMPEMNGIETAQQIRWITGNRQIPIMFVTSLCDRDTVMQCKKVRPESYIVRPYKEVYLQTEIKRILGGWGR